MSPLNERDRPRLLGATVSPMDAARDAVLAGVFTSLVAAMAHGTSGAAAVGLVGGGFLGVVLHLVPPEPVAGDSRSGRIVIRALSGAAGGAGLGAFLRWFFDWSGHQTGSLSSGAWLGAGVGLIWYTLWGLWETRSR